MNTEHEKKFGGKMNTPILNEYIRSIVAFLFATNLFSCSVFIFISTYSEHEQ